MFLHYMCTGFGIHKFRSIFSNDLPRNDKIASDYYNAYSIKHSKAKESKVFNSEVIIGEGPKNNHGFNHKRFHCVQGCCSRVR